MKLRFFVFVLALLVICVFPLSGFGQQTDQSSTQVLIDRNNLPRAIYDQEQVQEIPLEMPGKFWAVGGNLSPEERGNVYGIIHFDQAFEIYKSRQRTWYVAPFVSVDITKDTKDLVWNNRALLRGGIKAVRLFRGGIIEGGFAYAFEKRFLDDQSKDSPQFFANTWFGSDLPRYDRAAQPFKHLPRSFWASVGNLSPQEGFNVQVMADGIQGFTFADGRKADGIIFIHGRISADTKGFDWNNKIMTGVGVKLAIPLKSSIFEIGTELVREQRLRSGNVSTGVTFFSSVYYDWTFVRR